MATSLGAVETTRRIDLRAVVVNGGSWFEILGLPIASIPTRPCVSAVHVSCPGRQTGADELGLNEHHQSQLTRYLRFARLQRDKRLRTVDAAFEDCMLSRYETPSSLVLPT